MTYPLVPERQNRFCLVFALAFGCCGSAAAQPYCDLLLRPAFTASFVGNTILLQSASASLTDTTIAQWSYGNGVSDGYGYHDYDSTGVYNVCLSLSTLDGTCSSVYCRDVFVPENDCNGIWDSSFDVEQAGTNAMNFFDLSASGPAISWQWGFGDFTTEQIDASPTHTWLLPGPHFVHLTRIMDQCIATDAHWVTVDGNASTCGQDLFVNFSAYDQFGSMEFVPDINSPTSIQPLLGVWAFGDGTLDTAFATTHSYDEPGTYQACFYVGAINTSAFDTCFAFVCRTIEVPQPLTGIHESEQSELTLWPLPFDQDLHISAPWLRGGVRIRLYDTTGREVYGSTHNATGRMDLVLPEMPTGAYVMEINSVLISKRVLLIHN